MSSEVNLTLVTEDSDLSGFESPRNYEAEQSLLGAILYDNRAYEAVGDYLRSEHFADPVNGRIFEACQKLIDRGQVADAVQLRHFFDKDEALSDVGGGDYLANLQKYAMPASSAKDYGMTIFDLHLRRELIDLGQGTVRQAQSMDLDDPATLQIEALEDKLFKLAEFGDAETGPQTFLDAMRGAVSMAEAAYKRDTALVGVNTGLRDVNNKLGGLHKSDLLILAGRPAMGKTALATNIAYNAARLENAKVVIFSLEMSAEQLAMRILAGESAVSSDKIRRGDIQDHEMTVVLAAAQEIEGLSLFIDDTPAITVGALRTRARRLKRQHGLDMIIVDYLQLMRSSIKGSESRVQEISEITRGLKAIAKELEVPVLALSQLSRAVEQREDKKPMLSDLRESGSIEQDADVVMFVYRAEYYLEKSEPTPALDGGDSYAEKRARWEERMEYARNKATVIIGKQRHGPVGEIDLHFDGPSTTFSDLADDDYLPSQH